MPVPSLCQLCPACFFPNPQWESLCLRWDQDTDHFTQLSCSSRQGVLPQLKPSVPLTGLDHSLYHPNSFTLASQNSSLSHALCENSKKANAGISVAPKLLNNQLLTNWEKLQETPIAMPVTTEHNHTHLFIYLNALKILIQTRSSKCYRCTRGNPPLFLPDPGLAIPILIKLLRVGLSAG